MPPRRSKTKQYPLGIDPAKLPRAYGKYLFYDPRGRGRWVVKIGIGKGQREIRMGDSTATMADLYQAFATCDQVGPLTLRKLIERFKQTAEWNELRSATKRDYDDCIRMIVNRKTRSGVLFGEIPADQITIRAIKRYRDKRSQEASTRTAHELRFLSRLYNWALEEEYVDKNPATHVRIRRLEKPRGQYVTDDHYMACLNLAPINLAVAFHLIYLTGRRRGDVIRLTRAQLSDRGIEWSERKTGKESWAPWTDELRATVDLLKDGKGFALFIDRTGKQWTDKAATTATKRLNDQLKRIGFDPVSSSAIRAKYSTDLEESGGDASESLMHSSRVLTDRHYKTRKKVTTLR